PRGGHGVQPAGAVPDGVAAPCPAPARSAPSDAVMSRIRHGRAAVSLPRGMSPQQPSSEHHTLIVHPPRRGSSMSIVTAFNNGLRKVFGSRNDRLVKSYRRRVEQVNALEPT